MQKYLIKYTNKKGQDAGFKAREDILITLKKNNFKIIDLITPESKIEKIGHFFTLKKHLKEIEDGSYIVIEWPLINIASTKKIIKILKSKQCKVVTVIHDMKSLRFEMDDYIKTDIGMFNMFDVVISHNKYMSKWLKDNGLKTKCIDLEIFDYILPKEYHDNVSNDNTNESNKPVVAFAGNLGKYKSGFLYNMNKEGLNGIELKLYGPNVEKEELDDSIKHIGSFGPEEITVNISADYGLLWDGESTETCEGNLGRYLKYNNPHKVSLYIASRLPVIVWKEAAIADFVTRNNIGITVESLSEISTKLNEVKNYEEMKNNIEKIRTKLINGEYLLKALDSAFNDIYKS